MEETQYTLAAGQNFLLGFVYIFSSNYVLNMSLNKKCTKTRLENVEQRADFNHGFKHKLLNLKVLLQEDYKIKNTEVGATQPMCLVRFIQLRMLHGGEGAITMPNPGSVTAMLKCKNTPQESL